MGKEVKLKVREDFALITTFGEVTGENIVCSFFKPPLLLNIRKEVCCNL